MAQTHVIRGASHYGCRIKRILDKLPLRGQGRSPLKYTNCRVCISLEKKVCLLNPKGPKAIFKHFLKFGQAIGDSQAWGTQKGCPH
jgi:hypothetical protein